MAESLKLPTPPTIIRGEELAEKGFGGIYGVGKAALHPPALVVLSHEPKGATQTVAWVGKGIVYDTGGLSIKVTFAIKSYILGQSDSQWTVLFCSYLA